ncbi:MAG: hypothetical protein ACJ762_06335 [Solirubrobacteraceae bacterium]
MSDHRNRADGAPERPAAQQPRPSEIVEAARTRARFMGLSHFQAAQMIGELLDGFQDRIEALERQAGSDAPQDRQD